MEAVSRRINVVAGLTGGGGVRRAPLMESLGASSQLSMEKHVLTRLEAYSTEQTESCSSHQGRMQGLSKLEDIEGGCRSKIEGG